ncbi:MAG: tetratricopeptide repeat protein [Proteobacteria bacterium]|nr:tetratricopeptide repeat protein [Pseudomonadota bacterium]
MRLALTLVAVAASAASASPGFVSAGKPIRKPAPTNIPDEVLRSFVAGIVADKRGDLSTATRRYQDTNQISPQANTYYNLADVQRRMERIKDAVASYQKYLELAPAAGDRKAVEQVIAELTASEPTAALDGDGSDGEGLIFLDGKLLGPSPQVVHPPVGKHVVARLTATGFNARPLEARLAETVHLSIRQRDPDDGPVGNVVLSSSATFSTSGSWKDGALTFEVPGRFTLAPGHYKTQPWNDHRACNPVVFDVPTLGKNQVVFVFIDAAPKPSGTCAQITTRTQIVTLPGASS